MLCSSLPLKKAPYGRSPLDSFGFQLSRCTFSHLSWWRTMVVHHETTLCLGLIVTWKETWKQQHKGLKRIWKDNRFKTQKKEVHTGVVWYFSMLKPSNYQKSFLERKLGFGVLSCRFSCSEVCLYASADYEYWWPCDIQLLNTYLHTPCVHLWKPKLQLTGISKKITKKNRKQKRNKSKKQYENKNK